MKLRAWLIIILVVLVWMMIRDPKKTTAQITSGEQGAFGVGGAVVGGFLTPPSKKGG